MKEIIHRANFVQTDDDPLFGMRILNFLGYNNFEIDLWMQNHHFYKFHHPIGAEKQHLKLYKYNDSFLEHTIKDFDDCVWFIDIKFKDIDNIPVDFIEYISSTLRNSNVIIISTSTKLLKLVKKNKMNTGLIVKNKKNLIDTSFKFDFYIIPYEKIKYVNFPPEKVIPYFENMEEYYRIEGNSSAPSFIMIENPIRINDFNVTEIIDLEYTKIERFFINHGDEDFYLKISDLIKKLMTINKEQWDLEDLIRDFSIDLNESLKFKKDIDEHNKIRVKIITEIDNIIIEFYKPHLFEGDRNYFSNSETIGRLLDKILIFIIRKAYFIAEFVNKNKMYEHKIIVVEKNLKYQKSILFEFIKNLKLNNASYAPEGELKDYKPRNI